MFTIATVLCLLSFDDTLHIQSMKTDPRSERQVNTVSVKHETADAFVRDPWVRAWFKALFQSADRGCTDIERSAWVSGVPGHYAFDPWPRTGEMSSMTADRWFKPGEWNVHTHPNRKSPCPSATPYGNDQKLAKRMGKPIYTIHQLGIWKYDPKTNRTTRLLGKSWRLKVDQQMVNLIVSYIRTKDETCKIQKKMEAAGLATVHAPTLGKRNRAKSKFIKLKMAFEKRDMMQHKLQTKLTQISSNLQASI